VYVRRTLALLGSYSRATALLWPVAFLAFVVIFTRSAWLVHVRRRVTWRGQPIELAPRRPGR
jgi:hypothetical protein